MLIGTNDLLSIGVVNKNTFFIIPITQPGCLIDITQFSNNTRWVNINGKH